jgi:hypothetical protein
MPLHIDLPAVGEPPICKGEALTIDFTLTTAAETLDGWNVRFTARDPRTRAIAIQMDLTVLDAEAKTVRLALTHAITQRVAAGSYPYDIWRIDEGSETCLRFGTFHLTQETLYP